MEQPPKKSFDDFYLSDTILESLAKIGYDEPTPVQRETIPLTLAGIDLIVQSQTGTGKTAACAIPVLEMLDPQPGRVEVLVLAPTRELAKQVCREFESIGEAKGIEATPIYGGTSYEKQYKALETAQVVAATPGRLLDLLKRGRLDLDDLRFFALDEADEMMSMGFREELEAIVEFLPEERQSLLFSATVTEAIKSLAQGMLFYPEYITLSSDSVAAESVQHDYYKVDGTRKTRDLVRLLNYLQPDSAIVFANTRADTFAVTEHLQNFGFNAEVLNGELPQKEREKTLGKLRAGELDFLVATDVAARGIDISDLSYVINYAMPRDPEVYVHRTGRTGRIGKTGHAVSIVSPADMASLMQIEKVYDVDLQLQQFPQPHEIVDSREKHRVVEVDRELAGIEFLPYGGQLGVAEHLLEEQADGVNTQRLCARLLALADRVLEDEVLREELTALPDALAEEGQRSEDRQRRRRRTPESDRRSETDKAEEAAPEPEVEPEQADLEADSQPTDQHEPDQAQAEPEEDSVAEPEVEESWEEEEDSEDFLLSQASEDFEMKKMYMDIGYDHFDDPEELRETICTLAGMGKEDFGEIVLKSRYSFIEVREDYFYDIINALNNQTYEGNTLTAEPARS